MALSIHVTARLLLFLLGESDFRNMQKWKSSPPHFIFLVVVVTFARLHTNKPIVIWLCAGVSPPPPGNGSRNVELLKIKTVIAIYAPMMNTAPCVMLLMRAACITWASGRGPGPGMLLASKALRTGP